MAIREVVGLFDNEEELLSTIDELEGKGFDRCEISVMPSMEEVEKVIGHQIDDISEAAFDPETPRSFPLDFPSWGDAQGALIGIPFLAGAFAVTIFGAASGFSAAATFIMALLTGVLGSAIGFLILLLLRRRHQQEIEDQIDRGGLAMWVHVRDNAHARRVIRIFNRHHAHDVRFKMGHQI